MAPEFPGPLVFGDVMLNFAMWPANSTLTLTNVKWDQQYRNVVRFPNRSALNSYLSGAGSKVINNVGYIRANEPIRLEDPFNTLWKYNYIRVSNPAQPTTVGENDVPRDYYYFITNVEHVAPNTTLLTVELDVWQTFIYDVQFGYCYVERGHAAMAQNGQLTDNGRRYLSAPEGLETGAAMEIVDRTMLVEGLISDDADAIIFSTADLSDPDSWGDAKNPVTPGPVRNGQSFGVSTGMGVYVVKRANLNAALSEIALYPWIVQTITSILLVPNITTFIPNYTYPPVASGSKLCTPPISPPNAKRVDVYPSNWRTSGVLHNRIPAKFRSLNKFKTFPYCSVELDYAADNVLTLRPEEFNTQALSIALELFPQLSDAQVRVLPVGYLTTVGAQERYNNDLIPDLPVLTDNMNFVTSGSLPHMGVANNNAALSLANSAYTRAFQSENADYSREKALMGAQNSYDASVRATDAQTRANNMEGDYAMQVARRNADWASQDVFTNGARSVGMGILGGSLGGPAAAAGGAALGIANVGLDAIQTSVNNRRSIEATAQANTQSGAMLENSQSVERGNRAANFGLANWAAQGDYQQAIAAQNASVRQTKTIPPSMQAMPQGSISLAAKASLIPRVTLKAIPVQDIIRIGNFWLRYGYAIGEYMTPPNDLKVMSAFSYWKMTECNIVTGAMTEFHKNVLRGIMEKGVTVHSSPDSIGLDVTNTPIMGDYY